MKNVPWTKREKMSVASLVLAAIVLVIIIAISGCSAAPSSAAQKLTTEQTSLARLEQQRHRLVSEIDEAVGRAKKMV